MSLRWFMPDFAQGTELGFYYVNYHSKLPVISGRTGQHKLVHFRPAVPVRSGSYAWVQVTGAAPHHLMGELLEVTAEPLHKVRIPVAAG